MRGRLLAQFIHLAYILHKTLCYAITCILMTVHLQTFVLTFEYFTAAATAAAAD